MSGLSLAATLALTSAVLARAGYPVTVTNCGLERTYTSKPSRAISQNQGTTEFMLAMGLEGQMVGTAYLDDEIWPQYKAAYDRIPVLASGYATEEQIDSYNPDFISGSYSSAFYEKYYRERNGEMQLRGIFNETLPPCVGVGSEFEGKAWRSCRPQLHAAGIGTFLLVDYCEDTSLRPTKVTEQTVYSEMESLGKIFDVEVQPLIDEIKTDFDLAAKLVERKGTGSPMKAAWIDCMGSCCSGDNQVFVGGGNGAPNMLMQEAGLTNAFAASEGNWVCVDLADIIAAAPDVIVVVDASWDSADSKIEAMYNDVEFCKLDALKHARFVKIPFSATTLSPRNGPAALDLAIASLHVRAGTDIPTQKSGVTSFSSAELVQLSAGKQCPVKATDIVYTDAPTDGGALPSDITGNPEDVSEAFRPGLGCLRQLAVALLAAWGTLA